MKAENLLVIAAANVRMNVKHTLLPAIVLLFVIPFLYGTGNLDRLQSADCLERMVILTGIPMFTALTRNEHPRSVYETAAIRPTSLRVIVSMRMGFSIIGTCLLISAFEIYMKRCGCSFPFFLYMVRTLAGCMALGFTGLLLACAARNTAVGYLGAFCFYFMIQGGILGRMCRPVTNGVSCMLLLFLAGAGLGVYAFVSQRTIA